MTEPLAGVGSAIDRLLRRLSDAQLVALANACAPLASPGPALAATVAGAAVATTDAVGVLCEAWAQDPSLTGAGVALALRTGLSARRAADARRTRPVWTGPGATGEQRLTAAVLHELIAGAQQRILLVSYAVYTQSELAADLAAAVNRGVAVDAVFESAADNPNYHGPSTPPFDLPGITRWRWPADKREPGASLHAKLLVVDGRRALIGSANLTALALAHNIEAGVLTEDAALASAMEAHVRWLIANGTLTAA